ncbi:MAG: glycosyltransferase family 9 protein [Bdellovibrionales bacterium]|nr:glycosyltransferase family 9 protein [Bdellovibrionales bacterium]
MKILCVQLARFGDIYQSWPTLNALKRSNPDVELHFLVRERFAAATVGLAAIDRLIQLPSREIFEPLFSDHPGLERSLRNLNSFTDALRAEEYDLIVNLSFSPSSSYLVDIVAAPKTVIRGYTRHTDGFLAIPDDASSYFYAQVGVERNNRIHVTDLFALVAGVELNNADFTYPKCDRPEGLAQSYIVIHVGASSVEKSCSANSWSEIVAKIQKFYSGQIVFVGASGEECLVPHDIESDSIVNWVGRTELKDLFGILSHAEALIGADSVALHVASLTATPSLNISFASVRFWETGPRAPRSRVLWFEDSRHISSERVAAELQLLLAHKPASSFSIEKIEEFGVLYKLNGYQEASFSWELVRALYMNIEFPIIDSVTIRHGFMRLGELATLGLDQMSAIQNPETRSIAIGILDEIDSLVHQVGQFVPEIGPVVRWFQTEKLRIGPASMNEVLATTRTIFEKLRDICQIYELNQTFNEQLPREDLTWKL